MERVDTELTLLTLSAPDFFLSRANLALGREGGADSKATVGHPQNWFLHSYPLLDRNTSYLHLLPDIWSKPISRGISVCSVLQL